MSSEKKLYCSLFQNQNMLDMWRVYLEPTDEFLDEIRTNQILSKADLDFIRVCTFDVWSRVCVNLRFDQDMFAYVFWSGFVYLCVLIRVSTFVLHRSCCIILTLLRPLSQIQPMRIHLTMTMDAHINWRWMLTSSNFAVPASTSFEGCGSFGIVCREGPCWPLRARSFAIGLTIATASSVELLRAVWIAYSPSWTLRRDSSSTFQSFHISRWPSVMSFTGFQSSVALNTKSASSCETALSVRRHLIYRNSASRSPPCWVVRIFDLGRNDLLVPQFRTVNYGLRGFAISGPRLWNTLPHDIRQSVGNLNLFKNKLKTYFFQLQQHH